VIAEHGERGIWHILDSTSDSGNGTRKRRR
jgi:hypothetical protein